MLLGFGSGKLAFDDFYQDSLPDYPVGTPELLDMRDVTDVDLTTDQIRSFASIEREGPGRISRMAILTGSEVAFGLSRMFQLLAAEAGYEIKVFRDRDDAIEWLGS